MRNLTLTLAMLLVPILLGIAQSVKAQTACNETVEEPKWGVKFSGFIRADLWHDSRMIRGSRDDTFNFYPHNELINAQGVDLNKIDNFHASVLGSRFSGRITTPGIFSAVASGLVEADFSGANNSGLGHLRVRHMFMKLDWTRLGLLVGQSWHPLFVPELTPTSIGLSIGAPFQPFMRAPLIQLTYSMLPSLKLIGAVIAHRDQATMSPVTNAPNPLPLRYSKIPNIHLQLQYKNESVIVGTAADYKRVRPRILTADNKRFNNQYLSSTSYMLYFKYSTGMFALQSKAVYGQNLSEHLMLGGYAVEKIDTVTGIETYTPYNHLFLWLNPSYGKTFTVGLFAGYAVNLGTSANTDGKSYYAMFGDVKNIEKMYRISPNVSFRTGSFKICMEYEHTGVFFGMPDNNDRNLVKNSKLVYNNRLLLALFYFF